VTPVELALNRTAGGKVTKAAKGAIARQLRRPWLSLLSRAEVDARETQSRVVALVRADVESISICPTVDPCESPYSIISG
jgi:hypothetical protein